MKPIQLPLSVRLRDDATFANYYPGANAAALGYVERLCEAEAGWAESLIYLWGHDGVGRSHLLQAACLRFEQFEERTIYLPMADLVQYGPEIFDDLEQCELVCIDDLDVLVGKREWEEGLFHLFNRLRDTGRRLLLAASKSPRELQVKLPDLKSRLTMALIFQLHGLSDEDKLRALQLRASRRGLHLTDEVGRFILNRGSRSMNSLFDLLEQLDRASLQAQRKLTIPFLKETLGWYASTVRRRTPAWPCRSPWVSLAAGSDRLLSVSPSMRRQYRSAGCPQASRRSAGQEGAPALPSAFPGEPSVVLESPARIEQRGAEQGHAE